MDTTFPLRHIHSVPSSGTQRRALRRYQTEEMKIFNISIPRVGIELTTCRVYSRTLLPLRHNWPACMYFKYNLLKFAALGEKYL